MTASRELQESNLAGSGCVTYDEVLRLPGSTRVLLKDGKVGHIVSWYHTAEAVAVQVEAERRYIRAQDLLLGTDGVVVESPQVSQR